MLFVLSDDLLPFCSIQSGQELEGLQNLLLCVRQGQHAITGSYAIFSALYKNSNLAQRERATALNLANRRTELPLLEAQVRYKIFVTADFNFQQPKRLTDFCWKINICSLNSKFLNPLVVLAENILDAELYQQASLHYQISKHIKSVRIKSLARGGGGSQIDVELKNLLSEGAPVFAITDGDLIFPSASLSTISNRCKKLISDEIGLGWHFSLPTREIENIIPLDLLRLVADPENSSKAYESIKNISKSENKTDACPSKFSCLKRGQTLAQVFASKNNNEKSYWLSVANEIKHQRPKSFRNCLSQGSCDSSPCSCSISSGFGDAVLAQVKNWLAERSNHDSLKSFSSSEIWMEVGGMIFDAGIAFKPEKI